MIWIEIVQFRFADTGYKCIRIAIFVDLEIKHVGDRVTIDGFDPLKVKRRFDDRLSPTITVVESQDRIPIIGKRDRFKHPAGVRHLQ